MIYNANDKQKLISTPSMKNYINIDQG